jgi:hypothetical protein
VVGELVERPVGLAAGGVLELKGTVKTYRYRDPNEENTDGTATGATPGATPPAAGTPPVPGAAAVTSGVQKTQAAANQAGGSR